MNALTKKAVRDVTRRRLRTTLTAMGIAIGVMGLTGISLASSQFSSGLQAVNDTTGQPDIQFFTAPTTAPVEQELGAQPNVKDALTETAVTARWAIPSGHEQLAIVGVRDFGSRPFHRFSVTSGVLPGPGQILMESADRSIRPIRAGDVIELQVGTTKHSLRVSGLAHTPGVASPAFTQRGSAYMRESDLQSLFGIDGTNVALVRLDDYGQRKATASQLGAVLRSNDVVVLQSMVGRDVSGGSSGVVTGIFTIMGLLSVVALLLSAFLIVSTITTLVTEQVPVIGTMKALGACSSQVMRSYLTGVAVYGAIGTVTGLGLGDLLYRFFAVNLGMDPDALQVAPSLIVTAILVGMGAPLLAGALPIYLGTRVTVRQAQSGYGLHNAGGRRGHAWAALVARTLRFLPGTTQLGARGLFRRRTRALLTIAALAITGAAFLSIQTTTSSWNAAVTDIFGSYHADVFARFDSPQPYGSIQPLLAGVPGVVRTEPLSQTSVHTKYDPAGGPTQLTGVLPDAVLYHKHVVSGRWLTDSDRDAVVISEDEARRSGLKVGDTIDFHTDLYQAHWRVIGVARDLSNAAGGGVLLTTVAQANAFNHLPADYVQAMMIGSTSSRQSDVDALARHVDDTLGGTPAQATVVTAQAQIQTNQLVFLILDALFYAVVAIIALVGGIGLFNALAMGVLERRREIGILRSMGATGRKVAQVFWTEGVSLGIVAWVIACLIGVPIAYGFIQFVGTLLIQTPFALNPVSMLLMLVFIVAVASLATIGPVWSASRVKIAATLRYE
jgi:putative ABC transport system permease protein